VNYPPANVSTQADDFHGEIVADPYRTLGEVPGHTLKFGAAVQAARQGRAPILVRVETAAGHSAGRPGSKAVAEAADMLAFLESALSEKPLEIRGR
jgi:hypothetical protein